MTRQPQPAEKFPCACGTTVRTGKEFSKHVHEVHPEDTFRTSVDYEYDPAPVKLRSRS